MAILPTIYNYIQLTGTIIPDTAAIRLQVEQEYRSVFGEDLSLAPDTPQGRMIEAETLARIAVATNNATLANQINPNIAGGVFLDALGALTGLSRNADEYSLCVDCVLGGVPGASVFAGSSKAKDAQGNVYFATVTTVFDGAGQAIVTFQAEVPGAISTPANTLTSIVDLGTPSPGWEAITNPTASALGAAEQSDISFKILRSVTLGVQGSSQAAATIARVNLVPGVRTGDMVFRENYTGAPIVIDDVPLVPHSIYVDVYGGTDEAVATAISQVKSAGAAYNGNTSVDLVDPSSGQVYTVLFSRPVLVPIYAAVTIAGGSGVPDPVQSTKEAIIAYANGQVNGELGLVVGADVSPFELAGAVTCLNPSIFVKDLQIGTSPGVLSPATIDIFISQKATIGVSDIVVETV